MISLEDYILINEDTIKHYVDGIIISEDRILILRRANYMRKFGGYWGFVGGSIDKKDNNSKEAIIREIKEETGIELTVNEQNKMKSLDTVKHDNNSDTEYWLVNLESKPEIKISKEHSKYEWIDNKSLSEKTYKFIPGILEIIEKYLK